MRLNELKDNAGSRKLRVRVGRGIGSGMGKQAGRGGKGQTARSGVRLAGFEGGQMPLHRRLPKRGFNKRNRKVWNEINLGRLQEAVDAGRLDAGKPVDVAALVAAGLARRTLDGVRLLGEGELKAGLKLTVNHATATAKAAVEKAGGSVTLIVKKVLAADEAKRKKICGKEGRSRQAQGCRERGMRGRELLVPNRWPATRGATLAGRLSASHLGGRRGAEEGAAIPALGQGELQWFRPPSN